MTFEEWIIEAGYKHLEGWERIALHQAWNASNKVAREECAVICTIIADEYAAEAHTREYGARKCVDAIRGTIK